jgi:citrate lyase beta subunit
MAKKPIGASLYVPSTHQDLTDIANGTKLPQLRSVIFCTEDAVAERDLSYALFNLSMTLENMLAPTRLDRFVRVRSPEVMERVLAMQGSEKLTGFVIPKTTHRNFDRYFRQVKNTDHLLMPTLETVEVFDDAEMRLLLKTFCAPGVVGRIHAIRIGGNDLLSLLGIRRPRNLTIYRTPLGPVIARLVTTFQPYGLRLTSPVFEHLDVPEILAEEVMEDLAYGMVGKTAIHPKQVALIEQHYRVRSTDVAVARKIMAEDSPAVFKMGNSMCEVATHKKWAQAVIEQASHFGTDLLEEGAAHRIQMLTDSGNG